MSFLFAPSTIKRLIAAADVYRETLLNRALRFRDVRDGLRADALAYFAEVGDPPVGDELVVPLHHSCVWLCRE